MQENEITIQNALEALEISKQNIPTIENVLTSIKNQAKYQRVFNLQLWDNDLMTELMKLGFNLTIHTNPFDGNVTLLIKW